MKEARDSHVEFMRLNGARIAACGWGGYKEKGRGMVCVLSDLENEVLQMVPFDFMPEIVASKMMKPWYGSKEARMVASYEPQKEVVVCFIRNAEADKTDMDCYKIKTRPAPPDSED